MVSDIRARYYEIFGGAPSIIVRSPGRINLIGEHTDYNNGWVMPAAIDKAIWMAISPRTDTKLHFVAYNLNEQYEGQLNTLQKSATHSWANYLLGVLFILKQKGHTLSGINLVFGGNLPSGGGVSSSAAIENGMVLGLNEILGLGLSRLEMVQISQQAENEFVGMNCGVMDMFASMMGRQNHLIQLDCRSLEYNYVPFALPSIQLVLCNSGVKHQLVDSEYNVRRNQCEEGVACLQKIDPGIGSLRDVSWSFLAQHKDRMTEVVYQRCAYVVQENERVLQAGQALAKNDVSLLGRLMNATHDGLDLQYEVSCPELNFLAHTARAHSACAGARMMGGGFGGCTLNVVNKDALDSFLHDISAQYEQEFDRTLESYTVSLENGTALVNQNTP
jgi:galactokinase